MKEFNKLQDILSKLNFILSGRQKQYALLVLFMSLAAAILELIGVAIILPILDMLLNMEAVRERWFIQPFIQGLNLDTDIKIVWFICLATMLVYIFKNLYFTFYSWVSLKYAYKVQRELSARVLRAYLRQGYIFFVEHNTARMFQGISSDVSGVYTIVNFFSIIINKFLTIICIAAFILYCSKEMAIVLILLVVFCFGFIQLVFRERMRRNGDLKREYAYQNYKTSLEAIEGNKEILVMHKQDFFVGLYEKVVSKLNRVSVKVDLGTIAPAYIIEMFCMCGIMLFLAIRMGSVEDTYSLITQLSTIAVGAFRILPALGSITSNMNGITMNIPQLEAAYETLHGVKELEKQDARKKISAGQYRDIRFENEIQIKDVSFRYPNTDEMVLENVNFSVKKGQSVAFIGPSGAGKTTISDIILGLLKPSYGQILMDGIDIENLEAEWNRIVGYVPQMIYIVDDTIRHNIAFGEETKDIDDEQVWQALKIAQLDQFVRELPQGLDSIVGERGIRFSGGQRQRLAIARALYRNPEVLILDEATAALDNETEAEVMKAIEALQGYKTLIIVAHRLTTVRNCDIIYEVQDKKVEVKDKKEIF